MGCADAVKTGVAERKQQGLPAQSNVKRDQEESGAMKALKEANEMLRTRNTELEATIKRINEEMAEIKRLVAEQQQQRKPAPEEMTEDEPDVEVDPRTTRAAGPAPKRRATENIKERRLSERIDNLEDRFNRFEEYIRTTFTKTLTDRFVAIEQTCQQLATTVQNMAVQVSNLQQAWIGQQTSQPQHQ